MADLPLAKLVEFAAVHDRNWPIASIAATPHIVRFESKAVLRRSE